MAFLDTPEPKPCVVARSLAQLDDEEQKEALAALANPDVTAMAIQRAFEKRNLGGKHMAITRHRQGVCCCP